MTAGNTAAFVTGGSGFVGAAVLRHLVAAGTRVKALVRSVATAETVAALGAEPVRGDLLDLDALTSGMAGCRTVFHVAGLNTMCPDRSRDLFVTNVVGTRLVVEAAAAARVRRVVVTSSVTAGGVPRSRYARSKAVSEAVAFQKGIARDVEVVAVRPVSVQGPGRTEGSARLLLALARMRRPLLVNTAISLIDVDDCAQSHLLAAVKGRPGSAYVISCGSIATREAVATVGGAIGRQIRPLMVPKALAWALLFGPAMAGDVWPGSVGFCRDALATLLTEHHHDGSAAAAELGLVYRSPAATLERAVRWYQQVGLVPA